MYTSPGKRQRPLGEPLLRSSPSTGPSPRSCPEMVDLSLSGTTTRPPWGPFRRRCRLSSHCSTLHATIADATFGGAIDVPLHHRISAATHAELAYVRSALSRLNASEGVDLRTIQWVDPPSSLPDVYTRPFTLPGASCLCRVSIGIASPR